MKNARSASSVASRLFPSRKKLLLCALLLANAPVMALESLDDDVMSSVNGEGIAFLPEQVLMALQSAGSGFPGSTTADITNRANDTGYIRYIPVGPLSDATLTNSTYSATAGKADIFLYGLALSRADTSPNTRMNADATASNRYIQSWGTATNPWLLKVQSQANVPDFDTATGSGTVSYIALEAPFYDTTLPTTRAAGLDAYNLKLGMWADIFNRKWDALEGAANQFDVGGANRQNRLRLQAIWNGFSLNGSNIRMFQTLGGATNSGGMSTFYNNTFGMSALLRLNSGNASALRAPVNTISVSSSVADNTGTPSGWSLLHGGWNSGLSTSQTTGDCNNGSSVTVSNNSGATGCQFMVQSRTRTDTKTRTTTTTSTWTAASGLDNNVFRFSTREVSGTGPDLTTPALNGGSAPTFKDNEGMYWYGLNMNLPLGSLAQPLTAGVASDGRNFVLELARIPNKAAAYTAIYTDYSNNADVIAKNCNVYRCGTALASPLSNYQASSATHGSITVGTTVYNATTNSLTAYTGADAAGVSFGSLMAVQGQTLTTTSSTTGSPTTTTEAQWIQRTINTGTSWTYHACTGAFCSDHTGTAYQWAYNGTVVSALTGVTNAATSSCGFLCTNPGYSYPVANGTTNTWYTGTTSYGPCGNNNCTFYSNIDNRNWTVAKMNGLAWSTATNATLDGWLAGQGSAARSSYDLTTMANQATAPALVAPAITDMPVNTGSGVIDGVLIQHLKFTTTGL